jgi:hypothetical protein
VEPPAGCKPGERVTFEGFPGEPDQQLNPKKKVFETVGWSGRGGGPARGGHARLVGRLHWQRPGDWDRTGPELRRESFLARDARVRSTGLARRPSLVDRQGADDSELCAPAARPSVRWPQVQPDLKTGPDRVARYKDAAFMTSLGPCTVKSVTGGSIK